MRGLVADKHGLADLAVAPTQPRIMQLARRPSEYSLLSSLLVFTLQLSVRTLLDVLKSFFSKADSFLNKTISAYLIMESTELVITVTITRLGGRVEK